MHAFQAAAYRKLKYIHQFSAAFTSTRPSGLNRVIDYTVNLVAGVPATTGKIVPVAQTANYAELLVRRSGQWKIDKLSELDFTDVANGKIYRIAHRYRLTY